MPGIKAWRVGVLGLVVSGVVSGAAFAMETMPVPSSEETRETSSPAGPPHKRLVVALPRPRPRIVDAVDYWKAAPSKTSYATPARLLTDLPAQATANRRKVAFIEATLPLILHANEIILRDRLRIEILHAYGQAGLAIDEEDKRWLESTADRYGVDTADFGKLLRRVDIVPPSLALAQAAEESGWGTSRFARRGKALFGQRVYRGTGGMVPLDRPKGETFRVRAFDNVLDGVRAYLHNLNTHFAYEGFRRARATMRRRGRIDGYGLTGLLWNYSERRGAYLNSIRTIMRVNGFHVLDRAQRQFGKPDT